MTNIPKQLLRAILIPAIFVAYHVFAIYGLTNNNYALTLFSPLVTLVFGFGIHALDVEYELSGIRNVYKNGRNASVSIRRVYQTDAQVISASMTKQSIFAAITVATLLYEFSVLLSKNQEYLSKIQTHLKSSVLIMMETIWKVLSSEFYFNNNILLVSFFLLSISVLLTVVSILCYDYAIRFNWEDTEKVQLLKKALRLDTYSFYSLTTAIIYFLGSVNPLALVFFNIFWGAILYYYYFFKF